MVSVGRTTAGTRSVEILLLQGTKIVVKKLCGSAVFGWAETPLRMKGYSFVEADLSSAVDCVHN
jgi:hypothetical protein